MPKKVFSGFIDDLSPQQLQTLDKFRERVRAMGCTEPSYDEIYLLRFLRARKFDLEKTTDMWKNYINWRKEKKVDEVAHYEFPELSEAKQYYPHAWFRTDKQGRPIYIERPGKIVLDKLNKVMSNERLEQHFINDYERLMNEIFPACTEAKGELISTTFYILDLKGVSARMMCPKIWELLKIATKIGQDCYPEILGTMYIVNTPFFFHGAWQLIKGFLDEKTRKKVHLLGSNYKKELLQCVDENDLPDFLGGKLTEAEYGPNMINEQGPWIKPNRSVSKTPISENNSDNVMYWSMESRNSAEMKEGFEDTDCEGSVAGSLPSLPKPHKYLEELVEGDFHEVADELPIKQHIKLFQPRASGLFNECA
jgi:hypothetical protein